MNHAKTICRNGKATQKRTATSAPPTARGLQQLAEADKGCGGTSQRQTSVPTPCDVANAFLTMTFLPRLQETEWVQDSDTRKLEREFYDSLSIVTSKYGIIMQENEVLPFPYNISASITALREKLEKTTQEWMQVRLIHHDHNVFFAKEDRFDTGMTLYYVPVIPLHQVIQDKKTAQTGLLLLSVYAYLYQVLSIPYYSNADSYLYSILETFEECMMEDGEEELGKEIQLAKDIGTFMEVKIGDPENLNAFKTRLKSFKPITDFDGKALKVAEQFYRIFKDHPHTRIDRNFYPLRFREELECESYNVTLDNYVSFCASLKGNLYENMCQYVNEDLQEYGEIDEPTRFLPYDGRMIENNNFDFEKQVFDSLDDLIALWQYLNLI